jgi:hypothetical protein
MASLFSPRSQCPCTECPEVVITDSGVTIKETADLVRLRGLMSETRIAPRRQSSLHLGRIAELLYRAARGKSLRPEMPAFGASLPFPCAPAKVP